LTAAAPNFGIAYASLGGQPIVTARSAIQSFDKQDWDESVFEGRANSFTSPLGEEYGYGKVLMIRSSLDVLDTTTRYKLKFGVGQEGNEIELDGIYIRKAKRISPGVAHEDKALYLVDLVDTRYKLAKLRKNGVYQFNCRRTGGTADSYDEATLDNTYPPARAWTWIRVIEHLWGLLNTEDPSLIGTFSAHPNVDLLEDFNYPDEILPENLRYDGLSLWEALNDVVRRVGCAIVFDNAFVHNFFLVRLGSIGGGVYPEDVPQFHSQGGSKVTVTSASTAYWSAGNTTRILGDGLFADDEVLQGELVVPNIIDVMFPTSFDDQASGELTSEYGRWYPKSITGATLPATDYCDMGGRVPLPSNNPFSRHIVYETKHARFAAAADTTPNNDADLDLRARKIAEDVYRTLVDCAGAHVSYAGIHYDDDSNPTIPGKTVSEVTWGDFGNGLRTDIYRSPPDLMPTKRPIRVLDAKGGVGGKIWFKVISISIYYWELPGCEYIRAEVTQKSCDANVNIGDIVYIFDPFFCWFNLPIAIMMRITGTATFAENGFWDGVTPLVCGVTPGKCFWSVDSVCCLEEDYGAF